MQPKVLTYTTHIQKPIATVFDFFSKAENLNELTPADLNFKILTPTPILMHVGTKIKYQIKLGGIPFGWKTNISEWNPPYKFADEQLSGPYEIWYHEHIFEDLGSTTKMTDIITYKSKGWILAPLLHKLFVDKRVNDIFKYRDSKLQEIFGSK